MSLQIRNHRTNETVTLSRDVCSIHPAWVHAQCETENETELQRFLDQVNEDDYISGEDSCGISITEARDYTSPATTRDQEIDMRTFKLAADTINGVYEVDSIPPEPTVIMSDFITELKEDFEGTKYGIVTQQEADQIDAEYGIKWL